MNHTLVTPDRRLDGDKCSIRLVRPREGFQLSYLKDNCKRVRYSKTLPFSIFTSIFTTSAMRRSRSVLEAVLPPFFSPSFPDCALVPLTSVFFYTDFRRFACLAIMPSFSFYFLSFLF